MKNAKSAIAIMLIASLIVPTVHAKSKKAPAAVPVAASSQASASSQAGGLPATNARVAALEAAVITLRADLAAEVAARMAADTRLANAILNEAAARQAADAALADQIAANESTVFFAEGSADNIKGGTVTVASKVLPAGTYFMLAAVQMVNAQSSGDANARCTMSANGTLLADTPDLQFPLLTTGSGTTSGAFGSTMFAPLQGTYSSSTPITVAVQCNESNGKNGGLNAFVQIAALKVVSAQ
jgi:hypothetical protein